MFCSFYRRLVRGFLHIAAPLHNVTAQGAGFVLICDAMEAFHLLKLAMIKPPILVFPDDNKRFFVHTDASKFALGTVLLQPDVKGKLISVQYASRGLTKAESFYSAMGREAVAITFSLKTLQHHLLGDPFVVFSDHKALRSAFEKVDIHGRQASCLNIMAEHVFKIRHIEGKINALADYFSRSVGSEEVTERQEVKVRIEYFFVKAVW